MTDESDDEGATGGWEGLLVGERRRLLDLVDQLGDELDDASGGELSSADQHPSDEGTETQYREQFIGQRDDLRSELREVDDALDRLRAGTYGRCEACGRPVGDERLRARPQARLCVQDEQLAEAEAARRR